MASTPPAVHHAITLVSHYDPKPGRFLSEDPTGLGGGDANLYRYAFNNPVNHVDPSGNAILVPREHAVHGGCEYQNAYRAFASDLLRDEIWEKYRTWAPREKVKFPLTLSVVEEPDTWLQRIFGEGTRTYYKVPLLLSLPPETWGRIEQDPQGNIHQLLKVAANGNAVLGITPESTLDWAASPQTRYRAASQIIDQFSSVPFGLQFPIEWLTRLASEVVQLALAAFARMAGIELEDLLKILDRWGRYVTDLVTRGSTILGNFLDGAGKGFNGFVNKIGDYLQKGLKDLGAPVELLDSNPTDGSILTRLLEYVGFSVEDLMGVLSSAIDPADYAGFLNVFDQVGTVLEQPQKLGQWLSGFFSEVADLASAVGVMVGELIDPVILHMLTSLWPEIVTQLLLHFVPGTGLIHLVKTIFKAAVWLFDNWRVLKEMFQGMGEAFVAAVNGDQTLVARKVEEVLGKSIGPIVSGLVLILLPRASNVPTRIANALKEAPGAAVAPVKKVLQAVANPKKQSAPARPGATQAGQSGKPLLKSKELGKGVDLVLNQKGEIEIQARKTEKLTKVLQRAGAKTRSKVEPLVRDVKTDYKNFTKDLPSPKQAKPGAGPGATPSASTSSSRGRRKRSLAQVQRVTKVSRATSKQTYLAGKKLRADFGKLAAVAKEANLLCLIDRSQKGSCFVKGTLVDIGNGQKPLGPGWIAGTTRVLTHTANEGGSLHPEQGPPQDHEDRRLIYLVVRAGQPDEVFLTLLRPLQWLKDYRVSEGAIIALDLPEMAVEGDAFVLKVAPCPTTVEGEGSLVTGTFAHKSGNVLSLKVASEREPLGVTASHWFWSIDSQQWVPAGMLQKGEKLLAKERVTRVVAIEEKDEPLPVYNLEVEGDHVYRVGHSGVLVHNASLAGDYAKHTANESPEDRKKINICNVAIYFREYDVERTLQIAAGPKASHFPHALPEDIQLFNGDTLLWVEIGKDLSPYLPNGKKFDDVVVVNALNPGRAAERKGSSYAWIFEVAAPVVSSGGLLLLIGAEATHPSIEWVNENLDTIDKLGFVKLSDVAAADPDLRNNLPSFRTYPPTKKFPGGRVVGPYSQPDAVQIYFKRK